MPDEVAGDVRFKVTAGPEQVRPWILETVEINLSLRRRGKLGIRRARVAPARNSQ